MLYQDAVDSSYEINAKYLISYSYKNLITARGVQSLLARSWS
jgi:hypothetical protein